MVSSLQRSPEELPRDRGVGYAREGKAGGGKRGEQLLSGCLSCYDLAIFCYWWVLVVTNPSLLSDGGASHSHLFLGTGRGGSTWALSLWGEEGDWQEFPPSMS